MEAVASNPAEAVDPVAELKNLGAEITSNEQGAISVNLALQGNGTSIDAELVHLKALEDRLGKLESLNLGIALITDAGLVHLKDLTNLQVLYLPNQITDAGLVPLAGMNLKTLNIPKEAKTDSGLKHYLAAVKSPTTLRLNSWNVTDAGLVHLKDLTNLDHLYLEGTYLPGTQVTDAGIAKLQQALPKCTIHR